MLSKTRKKTRGTSKKDFVYNIDGLVKRVIALEVSFGIYRDAILKRMGTLEQNAFRAGKALKTESNPRITRKDVTFEEAWSLKELEGYQYGPDALEQVRLGWELRKDHEPKP